MEKCLETITWGLAIAIFLTACGMEGSLSDSTEQTDGAKSVALESSLEEKELEDAVTVFERLLAENAGSISSYEVDCLRAGAVEAENQDAWLGEWSRTYVERGCGACMQVSETEEGGCHVMLEAAYYSHNGGASGELCFLDAERAFVPVWEEEWDWTGECAILLLSMENDILTVRSLGADYGCGVGVTLGGTYTQGEAVYRNENVLSETFTEEEQKRIKMFLEGMGYSYEEEFVFPVEYGYGDTYRIIGEFADGEQVAGEWYEWNFPTMGSENFTLFLSDDGYSYWYKWGTGYLTDDPEREEGMQGPKTGRREDEVFFPVITRGEMTEELEGCTVTSTFLFPKQSDEILYEFPFTVEIEGFWEGEAVSQILTLEMSSDAKRNGYGDYHLETEDINFDGCRDFRIQTGCSYGSGGVWNNYAGLVWNPEKKEFEVMESFPELQTDFDRERQRVVVRYQSGAGNEYVDVYTVVSGEYRMTERLYMQGALGPDGSVGYHLYHFVNNELADEHWIADVAEAAELYPDLDYWWRG